MRIRLRSLGTLLAMASIVVSFPCALNCAGVFRTAAAASPATCPSPEPCSDPCCPARSPSGPPEPSGAPCSPFLCASGTCPAANLFETVAVAPPQICGAADPVEMIEPCFVAFTPDGRARGRDSPGPPVSGSMNRIASLLHPHAI